MFMIIICHMLQYFGCALAWWFNVGVQIFLCISGFLYGTKHITNVPRFYYNRIKKILVPYYVTILPFALLEAVFARNMFQWQNFARALILNSTLVGAEHLWFVPTIILCYIITPILQCYRDEYVGRQSKKILLMGISIMVVTIYFKLFNHFFNPANICCYIIGYFIGSIKKVADFRMKYLTVCVGIIAFIGNAFQVFLEYVKHFSFRGSEFIYSYCHVALGVFLFLFLKHIFDQGNLNNNRKTEKVLRLSDKYSYEIYLVHQLVILGPFSLMSITNSYFINLFIVVVAICTFSFFVKIVEQNVLKMLR